MDVLFPEDGAMKVTVIRGNDSSIATAFAILPLFALKIFGAARRLLGLR